ncbi:MAG: hypothetical protein Q9201_005905 [Fulgogasparrea decipioides]
MNSRRAYYENPLHNQPPPSPPSEMPPLPQRVPQTRSSRSYRGGDSWRPQLPASDIIPQTDFTFRNNASAPQFPQNGDSYRPSNDRARRRNNHNGGMPHHRGRGSRWATAARPLLSSKRGTSPEQMLAQADAQNRPQRFLPADDVSDSAEEDMEESGEDNEPASDADLPQTSPSLMEGNENGIEVNRAVDIQGPPSKRRATATAAKDLKQDSSVPRWSNPDPYTVLPPVDDTQRKRKDVVKIIRKARLVAEKEAASENQVAANDDFISFGLEGDQISSGISRSPSPPELANTNGPIPSGAPTGPRSFSHLNHLHAVTTAAAPGVTAPSRPSANDLGPPPGLMQALPTKPARNMNEKSLYPDQAAALGNRKRTHDDNIKGDAVANEGKKAAPNGSVLRQWIAYTGSDPTPWLAHDHCITENPGFRLHKEICDFYEFVKPQRYEQIIREDLLQRLQVAVQKHIPECNVYCFGSFAAAMYLPNADMDLVVISSTFRTSGQRIACQSAKYMHQFAQYLQKIGLAEHGSIEVIPKAKVPLVKFVDRMTTIRVDVSFENETGLVANDTFNAWKQQYPAMPILTTLVKQFLMMRGLNEVVNGGLGGFSVTCLVTSLLQNLPRVQSGEVTPEQHLGEMLLEFLDLYGNQFDLARTGISMNPPGYYDKVGWSYPGLCISLLTIPKQAATRNNVQQGVYHGNQRLSKLAIMDPNKPDNDISGGSKNVSLIFQLFAQVYEEIMKAMRSDDRISLLDWMIGGNYRSIVSQRQRLLGLYKSRWGSPGPDEL